MKGDIQGEGAVFCCRLIANPGGGWRVVSIGDCQGEGGKSSRTGTICRRYLNTEIADIPIGGGAREGAGLGVECQPCG